MARTLWIIALAILALWLVGWIVNIFGSLIHLLLVVGIIIIAYNLIVENKRA